MQGGVHSRFVRFLGTGPEANLRFSIQIPTHSQVTIRLAAAHTSANKHIEDLIKDWPEWTFTARVTTFASEYKF